MNNKLLKCVVISFGFFVLACMSVYADVKTNANPQDYVNTTYTITMIKRVYFAGEIQPLTFFDDGSEWLLSEFSYNPWRWSVATVFQYQILTIVFILSIIMILKNWYATIAQSN